MSRILFLFFIIMIIILQNHIFAQNSTQSPTSAPSSSSSSSSGRLAISSSRAPLPTPLTTPARFGSRSGFFHETATVFTVANSLSFPHYFRSSAAAAALTPQEQAEVDLLDAEQVINATIDIFPAPELLSTFADLESISRKLKSRNFTEFGASVANEIRDDLYQNSLLETADQKSVRDIIKNRLERATNSNFNNSNNTRKSVRRATVELDFQVTWTLHLVKRDAWAQYIKSHADELSYVVEEVGLSTTLTDGQSLILLSGADSSSSLEPIPYSSIIPNNATNVRIDDFPKYYPAVFPPDHYRTLCTNLPSLRSYVVASLPQDLDKITEFYNSIEREEGTSSMKSEQQKQQESSATTKTTLSDINSSSMQRKSTLNIRRHVSFKSSEVRGDEFSLLLSRCIWSGQLADSYNKIATKKLSSGASNDENSENQVLEVLDKLARFENLTNYVFDANAIQAAASVGLAYYISFPPGSKIGTTSLSVTASLQAQFAVEIASGVIYIFLGVIATCWLNLRGEFLVEAEERKNRIHSFHHLHQHHHRHLLLGSHHHHHRNNFNNSISMPVSLLSSLAPGSSGETSAISSQRNRKIKKSHSRHHHFQECENDFDYHHHAIDDDRERDHLHLDHISALSEGALKLRRKQRIQYLSKLRRPPAFVFLATYTLIARGLIAVLTIMSAQQMLKGNRITTLDISSEAFTQIAGLVDVFALLWLATGIYVTRKEISTFETGVWVILLAGLFVLGVLQSMCASSKVPLDVVDALFTSTSSFGLSCTTVEFSRNMFRMVVGIIVFLLVSFQERLILKLLVDSNARSGYNRKDIDVDGYGNENSNKTKNSTSTTSQIGGNKSLDRNNDEEEEEEEEEMQEISRNHDKRVLRWAKDASGYLRQSERLDDQQTGQIITSSNDGEFYRRGKQNGAEKVNGNNSSLTEHSSHYVLLPLCTVDMWMRYRTFKWPFLVFALLPIWSSFGAQAYVAFDSDLWVSLLEKLSATILELLILYFFYDASEFRK